MLESDHFTHGYYFLEKRNNVLFAVLKGGWNLDTAQRFSRDFKKEAAPLCGERWGHFVDLTNWELGVPGVDNVIKPLVEWCIENGLTHAAHLYGESALSKSYVDLVVKQKDRVFERRGFDNENAADQWLAEQGFSQ